MQMEVLALLFNSYEFIFLYLPVVLVGYFALGRTRRQLRRRRVRS